MVKGITGAPNKYSDTLVMGSIFFFGVGGIYGQKKISVNYASMGMGNYL